MHIRKLAVAVLVVSMYFQIDAAASAESADTAECAMLKSEEVAEAEQLKNSPLVVAYIQTGLALIGQAQAARDKGKQLDFFSNEVFTLDERIMEACLKRESKENCDRARADKNALFERRKARKARLLQAKCE